MPSTICAAYPAAATVIASLCSVAVSSWTGFAIGEGANTASEAVPAKIAALAKPTQRCQRWYLPVSPPPPYLSL